MKPIVRTKSGFSLVELLTVIGIIAVLAAIIFPVMATVKEKARQSQCITNLKNIGIAVQLYKQDNRKYPDVLGAQVDNVANPTPFEKRMNTGGLYGDYIKSPQAFHCPSSLITNTRDVVNYVTQLGKPATSYAYDSYDCFIANPALAAAGAGFTTYSADNSTWERYTTKWAETQGSFTVADFQRQLRWRTPPSDTVITWCSNHASNPEGVNPSQMCIVLFLDGHTDMIPAGQVKTSRWIVPSKK